jgi:hypothetical protein
MNDSALASPVRPSVPADLLTTTITVGDVTGDGKPDPAATIHGGYGRCSKPYCHCIAYEGRDPTCGNVGCGHAYEDHWNL